MDADIAWAVIAACVMIVAICVPLAVRNAGREATATDNAARGNDELDWWETPEGGQAAQDALYPSVPEGLSGGPAGPPPGEESSGGHGAVPGRPDEPPVGPGLGAQLAAATGGETVAEEIERLEARLHRLYEEQAAEMLEDIADVDDLLEAGVWARCDWLERPRALVPA